MKGIKLTSYQESIELDKVVISWNHDNVLKFVLKNKSHIELKDSKEMFDVLRRFSNGRKELFVMTVVPEECSYDDEVREFSVTDECSMYTYAEAVVVRSLAHKLLINFTVKFLKPKRLMKMFLTEDEALRWLLSVRAKMESSQN